VTDLRGRAEVRTTSKVLAGTQHKLRQTGVRVNATDAQLNSTATGVRTTAGKIPPTRSILAGTNAFYNLTEQGIFYAGVNISQLNNCLGGVTQALDQVAVGQIQGAVSSLSDVSSSCQSVHSG
jgi:hypothetical protein